ncbi:hypothetical protein [Limnoraphis robusta]|uniref:Uncharacterized protein n=1 Tax=Limnoraphis robusta CCNP1315 TaxID=3110306 RepID=A0ABU5TZ73_9CYAN|nr:hypothetical protein [Limnoraphis robusta]MEA5495975.1 hypothetical protein [Limnoraphis robusta BA-68 BA1]MEA5520002.1 hypothetical protein [Limnoraphis robusta CCNP1315]MEA5544891.1 hypothetical protein [Limnoraphis robusta CCNP1324]
MGTETVLIGYISEMWFGSTSKNRFIRRWNRKVIGELPKLDSWPPLNHGMFSFSGADGVRGGYLGSIIYFGGRYKAIEWEWNEWLAKYEALLLKLYWTESAVYLHLSGSFPPYQFSWEVDDQSLQGFLIEPPKLPKSWNFDGSFRSWPPSV